MIGRLVSFCARRHWLVIGVAFLVCLGGELARRSLAGDVIPDLADPQIGIVADWMGHSATEIASTVTSVLTTSLESVPGAKAVRGTTMTGMAYVDVVFESTAGMEDAHWAILERMTAARKKLPPEVRLQVGPPASSSGWVFEYALSDPQLVSSLFDLRHFQDDVLRPAIMQVPGVAEVASVGGDVRQVRIDVKPRELRERGLAFTDVVAALRPLFSSGASKAKLSEIEAVKVASGGAVVRDVASVRLTEDMPTGMADLAGVKAVGGIVIAKRGANLGELVEAVKKVIARESEKLPRRAADPARMDSGVAAGVHVATTYDRTDLATRVRKTLLQALGEEIAVVVLVLLAFLLHFRSALVPLVTLPVVVLLTFAGMWVLGVPATIMSLGGIGIALGMAVDADIVALEASHRRLEKTGANATSEERRRSILSAAQSYAPAILTSLLITAVSFLPVFAFTGETGRLLRPLVLTKTLVIAAAALVTLTLAPALRDRLVRGKMLPEFDNPLTRGLVRVYRPFVHFALSRPALTLTTAALALASCLPIVSRLGGEFLPRVEEGELLYMPSTLPGVPPDQAATQLFWQDHAIGRFAEVASVFGKVGRAETGTDPAPYSMAETTIRLKPRSEWPKLPRERWYSSWAPELAQRALRPFWPDQTPRTTQELIAELDKAVRLPGWIGSWTTPARARMDMLATGIRTPVGIRIVSPDPRRLDSLGSALRTAMKDVPGTRSAVFESLGGETRLSFDADAAALARMGADPQLVKSTVALLADGGQIGEIEDDGLPLRVRISPEAPDVQPRGAADELREITVRANGQPVPLALLGTPAYTREPAQLRTENGELVAYVYLDLVDGTNLQQYVERARHEADALVASGGIRLLPGERIEWTGQYPLLVDGQQRLMWIIPVVLLSMFGLLLLQFKSIVEALLVLASVPFALVGSFWTLYLLGFPLSAPVWVGLLSVVGLAMQTGVVMVVYIDEAFYRRVREGRLRTREDIVAAHAEGTVQRLRPKIMTITTMGASLLPLLWSEGAGAEIMRRVAAPMLGGLLTSAFLTLEVLPVLYTIWRYQQLKRAQRSLSSIATVVGMAGGETSYR
jgi:Cu(I)/Ag(I) efflux system membrane protein CusA/SilA